MTKLEIEMFMAMDSAAFKLGDIEVDPNEECNEFDRASAKAAASVAKKHLQEAFEAGQRSVRLDYEKTFKDYEWELKEEGIL